MKKMKNKKKNKFLKGFRKRVMRKNAYYCGLEIAKK